MHLVRPGHRSPVGSPPPGGDPPPAALTAVSALPYHAGLMQPFGPPHALLDRALAGERLTPDAAMALHDSAPTDALMAAAHARRSARVQPADRVTYLVDRNINYTNVCITDCQFCAFYRPPGHPESYVNSRAVLAEKISELVAAGGSRILMQGGHHPDLRLEWYEDLLRWIRASFPTIEIDAFSPSEIQHIADLERMPIGAVLDRLIAAGLAGLPGGGAEILDDEVRGRISPKKQSAGGWIELMRLAQERGLATTATMVIGFGESTVHRIAHLERLRTHQDRALASHGNGFIAFIAWTAQFENTSLGSSRFRPQFGAGAESYLRQVALSRLYLDNFVHVQASWPTMGPDVAARALRAGADDFGSTMLEENVVSAAGTIKTRMDAAEIRAEIRRAGFVPAERDTRYRIRQEFRETAAAAR
jgi:cyclic dehypoxanthinyl futalosine synthase